MAARFLIAGASANAQTTASYVPLENGGPWETSSTAANRETLLSAGTYRNLSIYVIGYTSATTATVTLQVGGVNTALTVAVVGGATGRFEDLTHSVAVTDGQIGRLNGTSGLIANLGAWSLDFEATSGVAVGYLTGRGALTSSTAARLFFSPVGRNGALASTETTDQMIPLVTPGTLDRLRVRVAVNGKAVAQRFIARVNAADTALLVAIPASTTGGFEDLSNSVAVASGDTLSYAHELSAGVSGNTHVERWSVRFTSAGEPFDLICGGTAETISGPTAYGSLAGSTIQRTVEAQAQQPIHFATTASRLRAYVRANTNPAFAIRFRKNGAYGNQSLAIPTNGTGVFEDLTGTDGLTAGDLFCVEFGSTSNARSIPWFGVTLGTGTVPPVTVAPETGEVVVEGTVPSVVTGLEVAPALGALSIDGLTPSIVIFNGVRPVAGQLAIEGVIPDVASALTIAPPFGQLRILGATPRVLVGVAISPASGEISIDGGHPGIFTEFSVPASQLAALALVVPEAPPALASQVAALALAEPPPPPTRASQAALLAIGEIVPDVQASQLAILVLGHGSACVTEKCQIWKITRRDGRVFRYTSHDRPVTYNDEVYSSCRSLNPSASENASTLGSVANMELVGIIDDEGISEADLYGGLFDDAFVTVDLITWGSGTDVPRRLAAGWTGTLKQGETGFNMEVLGPGARLEQQALVQMVTPGCRWVFGSAECGVNVEAMKLSATVVSARSRGAFRATIAPPPSGRQWQNGRVRWTSGENLGQVTETKTVDFDTGDVVLWASPSYLPQPGDTFEILPGCDFARDGGCTVYANVINFGGFPDVPGADSLLETPDAQY